MNAQEAIENEQIELDELKSELKRREALVNAVNDDGLLNARTFQIEQVKMLKKLIEQKSIVLESAKYLHENLIKEKRYWNDRKITLKLNTIVAELTHVTTEEAEQLGIEVKE